MISRRMASDTDALQFRQRVERALGGFARSALECRAGSSLASRSGPGVASRIASAITTLPRTGSPRQAVQLRLTIPE